jgi:hypothetical protein
MSDERKKVHYYIAADSMAEATQFLPSDVELENVTVTSRKLEEPIAVKGVTFVEREKTSSWLTELFG